jgi:hypothetical protein
MKKKVVIFLCINLLMGILYNSFSYALDIEPKAVAKNETESNDTMSTANSVNQDDTIYGKISSSSDIDYFKVVAGLSGYMNFWLGDIPSGKDYDLYVYNSSGTLLGKSIGTTSQELVSNISVTKNSTYYFQVVGFNGSHDANNKYKVRAKLYLNSYAYYCQNSPNFTTTNLDNLYYKNADGSLSTSTWLARIKNAGCVASSYAMILKNLGATTTQSRYDVRTGSTSILQPDPFTVTYSNTLFPTITYTGGKYVANTTRDPVYMYHADAIGGFGKSYTSYSLTGTDEEKANAIAYYLTLNPEGVAVSFQDGSRTHTVVFISTTYETPIGYTPSLSTTIMVDESKLENTVSEEEINAWVTAYNSKTKLSASALTSNYDSLFTVCDPVGPNGNQVLFGNAYVGSSYGFSAAYKIVVIN